MKEDKVLNMVAAEKEATIRAIQDKIRQRRNRTLKDVKISDTTSNLAIDPTLKTTAHVIKPGETDDWVDVNDKKKK
jgi:hypothetical protein